MRCEVCGNEYDRAFTIRVDDCEHVFDSFECAIQALAPTCNRCGCRVLGHGVEKEGVIYCCANCAREDVGSTGLKDREDRGTLCAADEAERLHADALVCEASMESFPASDPPAWTCDRV